MGCQHHQEKPGPEEEVVPCAPVLVHPGVRGRERRLGKGSGSGPKGSSPQGSASYLNCARAA